MDMASRKLRTCLSNLRIRESGSNGTGNLNLDEDKDDSREKELEQLVSEIKDYQINNGFLLKLVCFEEPTTVPCQPVNVSVIPTPFPRKLFEEALGLQQLYNELYIRVASDPEWLHGVLKDLVESDDFTKGLWGVWQEVSVAGVSQEIVVDVFRSDYMIDQPSLNGTPVLKQIEMNTFSAAGACHDERAANMHKHLKRVHELTEGPSPGSLPKTNNTADLVSGLKRAHDAYTPSTRHPTCVLMVVQPESVNVADERPIEYGLWNKDAPCYRCDWQEVLVRTRLEKGRTLFIELEKGSLEVSVIYYRAGYEAKEYDALGKEIRLRLELSRAIKCPDLLTHLTTLKAVQAALTAPGAVERFLPPAQASRVRATFVKNMPLDSMEALTIALNATEVNGYVLKPNREGGGHNVYGDSIRDFVGSLAEAEYSAYTLMALVQSPERDGVLLHPNDLYEGPVVSELGILGTCLWRRKSSKSGVEIMTNDVSGWTFKSKPSDMAEMSVVKGYGCFDCPLLE